MKKGFYIFFMFFCFMIYSASAQFENIGKITRKTECTRRCNIRIFEVNKYEVEQIKLQEKYREAISKETRVFCIIILLLINPTLQKKLIRKSVKILCRF